MPQVTNLLIHFSFFASVKTRVFGAGGGGGGTFPLSINLFKG
jgi:hypothetical protein